MKLTIITIIALFGFTLTIAQVPSTEIFLIDLGKDKSNPIFDKSINISNNPGYDNQPSFSSSNDRIVFVSMRDSSQTDIYEYVISKKIATALAIKPESEYSPVYISGSKDISIVRVDADKGQRLYRFNDTSYDANLVIEGIDSVGYYCYLNDSTIALAVLNNGMDLYIYETSSSQFIIVANGIGRCLLRHPATNELIFTIKSPDGTVTLMKFDMETGIKNHFADGIPGVEDYVFSPSGELWAGHDGKLFSMVLGSEKEWKEIADFSETIGTFYRMALSPDGRYLAVVAFEGKRP